jgi:hypothetical protein
MWGRSDWNGTPFPGLYKVPAVTDSVAPPVTDAAAADAADAAAAEPAGSTVSSAPAAPRSRIGSQR